MAMATQFTTPEPARAEIDRLQQATVLEFGTDWCGYCRAAQPQLAVALAGFPDVLHMKVEDGSGRPLGRSFHVKLWPTLIFLRHGVEVGRLVRPASADDIARELAKLGT